MSRFKQGTMTMLKTEERMALMLKADIDQLREIDRILTGMNDRQKEKKSEDYRTLRLPKLPKNYRLAVRRSIGGPGRDCCVRQSSEHVAASGHPKYRKCLRREQSAPRVESET